MSTIQAAQKCTVTLDAGNVRRTMNQWKSAFATLVAELSSPDYDMGIQILSEEAWLEIHPIVGADGAAIPATPRLPARPGPLPGNATNAQIALNNQLTKIADTALEKSLILKAGLIESIGPDIASETAVFGRGHLDVATHTIYKHVVDNYGIMDADDILWFLTDLDRWDLDKPFNSNVARMRNDFAELASLNMFGSEVERVAALVKATRHVPSISGIIHQYMINHPALATQTFATLAAYIHQQLPVATAQQARANAAEAKNVARDNTLATLTAELAAARAEIAAFSATAKDPKKNPPGTRWARRTEPTGKPSAADKAKWTSGRVYCWRHGFQGHNGSTCTEIASEPQWKKDAVNPGPVNGQYGSRINE